MWPGAVAPASSTSRARSSIISVGREDQCRVEVALDDPAADALDALGQGDPPVDADDVRPGVAHQVKDLAGPDAEVDARHTCGAQPLQHLRRPRLHVPLVVGARQRPGPGVEQLHGRRAGGHLHLEVGSRDLRDLAHQRRPQLGVAEHQRLGAGVVLGGAALDEVRRHGERSPREADQGHRAELADQAAHRLGDVGDVVRASGRGWPRRRPSSARVGRPPDRPRARCRARRPRPRSGSTMSEKKIAASTP